MERKSNIDGPGPGYGFRITFPLNSLTIAEYGLLGIFY